MTWSIEIVSLVPSHGWKEHNSHYADIKLNEHWYNDISAKELSVQIDENDNCITVTDNAVLDQTLQKENTSKDKLNKEDNQQLFTKQIESTHEKTMNTGSDDEDTELVWRPGCSQLQKNN